MLTESHSVFSFTGVSDLLKEVREFVKDIWFRNRQEALLGELMLIEKRATLQKELESPHLTVLEPKSAPVEIHAQQSPILIENSVLAEPK